MHYIPSICDQNLGNGNVPTARYKVGSFFDLEESILERTQTQSCMWLCTLIASSLAPGRDKRPETEYLKGQSCIPPKPQQLELPSLQNPHHQIQAPCNPGPRVYFTRNRTQDAWRSHESQRQTNSKPARSSFILSIPETYSQHTNYLRRKCNCPAAKETR